MSGVDAKGAAFDGRFYLVRVNDRQVGFLAVAPADELAKFDAELEAIATTRWFWHGLPGEEATQAP